MSQQHPQLRKCCWSTVRNMVLKIRQKDYGQWSSMIFMMLAKTIEDKQALESYGTVIRAFASSILFFALLSYGAVALVVQDSRNARSVVATQDFLRLEVLNMWGIPWLDLKSHLLRWCLVFLCIALLCWYWRLMWAENNEQQSSRVSIAMCVFQTDAWCEGEWPEFGIQVPSQCEFTFQAKRASAFSGQKGLLLLVKLYLFSIVFIMNPPVSWASSSMLLVCSCQALPDFWVFFFCSCQVPRLQPPFAASGHLVLCLCVTPVQTFSLVVGPHVAKDIKIFWWCTLHLWGHQIMHAFSWPWKY